jgi:hypothetical protein
MTKTRIYTILEESANFGTSFLESLLHETTTTKVMVIGKKAVFVAFFAVAFYCYLYSSFLFSHQREERSGFFCSQEELETGKLDVFPIKALKRFSEKLYHHTWGFFLPRNGLDNWKHFVAHPELYVLEDSTEWPLLSGVDTFDSQDATPFTVPRFDRIAFISIIANLNAQTFKILQWIPKVLFDNFPGFVLRIPTIRR